jgi:hypothetical protein
MFHYQPLKFWPYQQQVGESKRIYLSQKFWKELRKFSSVEIWCGCSLGNLRIIDVRTAQLSVQLSHNLSSGSSAVHLLCVSRDSPYQYSIWTAMKTGIMLRYFIRSSQN